MWTSSPFEPALGIDAGAELSSPLPRHTFEDGAPPSFNGGGAPDDFRLRKRFEATVRLPGYAGGTGQDATSLSQVVTFIQGQNTGSAGEPGSASASGTGGGYTGGAACTLPP